MFLSSPIDHELSIEWPTEAQKWVNTLCYYYSMNYKVIESAIYVPDRTIQSICNTTSLRREANNPKMEEK